MKKTSVLLVEDHSVAREALTRLLQYEGFDARSAQNGIEARDAIQRNPPDLILLDLMLPKLSGVALLRSVRIGMGLQNLPVIVLTASLDHSQLDEVRSLGVSAVVQKAKFTLDELLNLMREQVCAAQT